MASVQGTGPVAITSAKGAHLTVPLSAIQYDGKNVTIIWTPPDGDMANKDRAKYWATYLLGEGELQVHTAPATAPAGPAFLIEATHPGLFSNQITVSIANVTKLNPPDMSTMNMTVSVENDYSGLTLATLGSTIGTSEGGGSEPGLIFLSSADPPTDKPVKSAAPVAMSGAPVHADMASSGGTAFTLGGVADIGAGTTFTVEVPADPVGDAFKLKVVWSKTVTGKTLAEHATSFASIVKITPPPSGIFGIPAVDPVTHSATIPIAGGADPGSTPTPAVPAKATVPAA